MKPGRLARADYEYERHVFMFFAPLKGWRHIEVTGRRTAISAISCFEAIAREVTAEEISVNSGGRWSLIISEAIAGIPPENKDSAYVEFEPWDECGYGSFSLNYKRMETQDEIETRVNLALERATFERLEQKFGA